MMENSVTVIPVLRLHSVLSHNTLVQGLYRVLLKSMCFFVVFFFSCFFFSGKCFLGKMCFFLICIFVHEFCYVFLLRCSTHRWYESHSKVSFQHFEYTRFTVNHGYSICWKFMAGPYFVGRGT